MFDTKLSKPKKFIIIAVLFATLALCACTGGPRGWPGSVSDGDNLYVGTMDGKLYSVIPDSGARRWSWEPEDETSASSSFLSCGTGGQLTSGLLYDAPVVANGTIYMCFQSGMIYALDGADGGQVWDYDLESNINAGLAVAEGTVFVGSSDGKLAALDAANGSLRWQFQTDDEIWSAPAVADGVVYFGSLDHKVYAVDILQGTQKWVFETDGAVGSSPRVVDGIVYIGSFDNKFYAIDAVTGSLKWAFAEAGNWFWSQAIYDNGTIYACCLDSKVYALDAGNGTLVWDESFEADSPLRASPVIADGVLVVASEQGKIFGLDPVTGEQKWIFDALKSKVLSSLSTDGQRVYINSQNNRLYALEGQDGHQTWNISLAK